MTLVSYIRYSLWAASAGALIPVMAVLNARLGRSLGGSVFAAVMLFAVGLFATAAVGLIAAGRWPSGLMLTRVSPLDLTGGLIVSFYILSITAIAPRFGIGNAILFVVIAQICTSAAIDHWGLFGSPTRVVTPTRLAGLLLVFAGSAIAQTANATSRS